MEFEFHSILDLNGDWLNADPLPLVDPNTDSMLVLVLKLWLPARDRKPADFSEVSLILELNYPPPLEYLFPVYKLELPILEALVFSLMILNFDW